MEWESKCENSSLVVLADHRQVQTGRRAQRQFLGPVIVPRRAPQSGATPMGASNLDAIINEGTLAIGWVGPALLGILIAAFGWAGRVFEWLGTLATWLFSGE